MLLMAQAYAIVYALVFLGLLLGVLAISIPRIRRKVVTEDDN